MRRVRSKSGAGIAGFIAGVLLVVLTAAPVSALRTESPAQFLSTMTVPGVSSDVNNISLAFDGSYSVVAPFETSDPDHQNPFFGDNHYLVVTDVKNPSRSFKLDLSSVGEGAVTCYYPTHLIVSSNNFAFVRASAANSTTHQPTDEVIAYGQLVLDKNTGNPRFDGAIIAAQILKFEPADDPGSIPIDFGVSRAGQFLVFTNGAQVFSYNLATGYKYTVQPVPNGQYSPLPDPGDTSALASDFETITSLAVDAANVVSVVVNGRSGGNDFSRILFYSLREGIKHSGTFDSLSIPVESSQFGGGQIAPGSEPAISPDGLRGYFATTDGSLWSVGLENSPVLSLGRLGSYSSMVGEIRNPGGPRNVGIDSSGTSLSVVKQGATMNIRRPSYGKHGGGIRRPSYAKYDGAPGLVLVYLNANGSVVGKQEVSQALGDGVYAISCPAFTPDGGAYIAASYYALPGVLKVLDKAGSLKDIGSALPNNIGRIVSTGSTLVGIKDFEVAAGGPDPDSGALVFMSLQQGAYDVSAAIRRPCNANH